MDQIINQKIKQLQQGDQSVFADIVELYKDKIYQLVYRMLGNQHEAEDIAQEAFIRAYINIHTFDTSRKFSTWLYRIATNLTIDRIRKKKPDYFLDAEISGSEGLTLYSQIAAGEDLPEDHLMTAELQEFIQKAIIQLPDKYRSVIVLKYIDELSLQEIGEILELPIGTIKTRLHRGRDTLRKLLGDL